MQTLHSRLRFDTWLRRCACGMLLLVYVLTAAGVPLPVVKQAASSGERFPCESCGCGCDTAEFCWRSCCCHTPAERLAWAREHGVRPPEFALAEARRLGLDSAGPAATDCCATPSDGCCNRPPKPAEKSCCSKKVVADVALTAKKSCCSPQATTVASDDASDHVIGLRALACRGQSLDWLAAMPTLVAVRPELSDQLPRVVWLGPVASDDADGISTDPAVPPPQQT